MPDLNLGYLGFRTGSAIARAIPTPMVGGTTRVIGSMAQRAMGPRRAMVERNLQRVYGPGLTGRALKEKVDETFESYTRYWVESFRLPGTSKVALAAGMTTDGYEHVKDALDAGNGVVLGLPHLGGWEWAAFWMATVEGRPVTAVVEPIEPPELADWFVGLRRGFGINVVPLGPSAGAECAKALKANHILCLLCDRDIAGGGVEVEFFGERTTMPGGPATLSLRSGAPLLPSAMYFDGEGHRGVARAPLDTTRHASLREDVARVTQDLANALEDLIRAAPEQWHLMQPNWPSDHEFLRRSR